MKTPIFLFLTLCLLSILTTYSTCNGVPQNEENKIAKFEKLLIVEGDTFSLAKRMKYYNVQGLSIAVIKDGEILWAKGYGIRDTSKNTPPKYVSLTTRFQAASISKPLAAVGVLKLVQQGKLELDKDVNDYLIDWEVTPMKGVSLGNEKVTLRRLLSHTAGVTVPGFGGYHRTHELPDIIDVLDRISPSNSDSVRVFTKPGTKEQYSGGGYVIVEKVVEDVTELSFEAFMHKEVIVPMAMAWSSYEQPLPKRWHDDASSGFDSLGTIYNGKWRVYPEQAAAGMWSTPSDIARYLIGVRNIVLEKPSGLISSQILKSSLAPVSPSSHGLGPVMRGVGNKVSMSHNGVNGGFESQFLFAPFQGYGFVIMTNSENGFRNYWLSRPKDKGIIPEIADALTNVYGWQWP